NTGAAGWGFLRPTLGGKFDTLMAGAAAVTAGSRILAEYAQKRNSNTFLLPTVVDTNHHKPVPRSKNGIFTIGWIGSPTTAPYLSQLVGPVSQLGKETPLKLVVVGGRAPSISGVTVEEMSWSEESEVALINSFDVGIMPLPNNEWARGKCAFKLIQYMACGVPVAASRVGANIDVVSSDCGILADNELEWANALRFLRDRPEDRLKMGQAGRIRAEQHYSLSCNLPVLIDILSNILLKKKEC
ncbi:glycosyltransferase family 4 protein, partial [Desulfobulbus sp. F3]|nr:glycosyltransferase family 4 protein [Desulfobulbus sp. F3]